MMADTIPIDPLDEMRRDVEAEAAAEESELRPEEPPEELKVNSSQEEEHGITSAMLLDAVKRNEDGDSDIYKALHRNHFRYDHAANQWHVWRDHHWEVDQREEALAGIRAVIDLFAVQAMREAWEVTKACKNGDGKKQLIHDSNASLFNKRIPKLREMKRKNPVLHLARAGADSLGITGDEWDRRPMLLPVQNGVIDLKTGELHDGRQEDYLRAYAPTAWQGIDAPAPTWEAFLESTFNRDLELIAFLARLFGYAITGETTEHILPILWGSGRNGKTVMLEAISNVLGGDLSGPLESEFLLESKFPKSSGSPSSDKLYLRGRRLCWLSETNENRKLNSGKVKLLTGGDLITGRPPYGIRQITFAPTHKIFLLTNHRPKADARDIALWRRVLLIPFTMAFVPNPDPTKPNERLADKELPAKLQAEKSGILAWLVRGCLAWQKEGLNPPESVLAATRDYQDTEDAIKTFIAEKCLPEGQVRASALYEAFKKWTLDNGEKPMTANKFGRCLSEDYDSYKDMRGKSYIGLSLCETE